MEVISKHILTVCHLGSTPYSYWLNYRCILTLPEVPALEHIGKGNGVLPLGLGLGRSLGLLKMLTFLEGFLLILVNSSTMGPALS